MIQRNFDFKLKTENILARMPRKELLPSRSSFLRTARNFLKELPRNKDGEDLPRGTSLRRGGEGWRARKFLKERRGRMARIFLDARKFLASRKFLEIRMAIEELPILIRRIRHYKSDLTESIYFNVAMGWQVPIHRSPIV